MQLRAIAIAFAFSGCAQLFGIEETSSGGGGSIAVRLQRVSVGASVEFNPLDVGTNLPAFLVADSADPSGVRKIASGPAEPGRWLAPVGKVEGVIYSYPDVPAPRLLSFPGFSRPDLRASVNIYEHPNPKPAPSPADVAVVVTLPTPSKATESFSVEVVGAWVYYSIPQPPPGTNTLSLSVPYTAFQSYTGGSVGQIAPQDVIALLRRDSGTLTGQLVVTGIEQTSATIPLQGTLAPVTPNQTFSATVSSASVANRFAAQKPTITSAVTQTYRVEASPGYALGMPVGFSLANGDIAPADPTTINAPYANPFSAQWHPVASHIATAQRSFNIGGTTAVLTSFLQALSEANPSPALNMAAGLPTMTTINDIPLNADGMTVPLNVNGPVYVDVKADRTDNSVYEVTVVEIAVVESQITRTVVASTTGVDPHLPLPPGVLQAGHTYYLAVRCTAGGYTEAASGNLQTFALPVSIGYQEGAVFTVGA